MPVLFMAEEDVRELMDMTTSIEVVEEAFRQMAAGEAGNVPRARASTSVILLHTMSAAAKYLGLVGLKAYTTTKQGARFHVAVYHVDSGEMVALRSLVDIERAHIEQILKRQEGNIKASALVLGISRTTLYKKIKQYGLEEYGQAG